MGIDPISAGIMGVAGLGSALIGSSASQSAAQTQADAATQAANLQYQQYQEQKALQEPFRQAGITGQNQLMSYLGLGGDTGAAGYGQWASPTLTSSQFQNYLDPGYQFRLSEGMKALDRSAASRGGLLSGGYAKGVQQYAQGLASEEYQNAFNRYQTSRAAALSPLQQLQGVGQAAASNQAAASGQYGTNVSNLMTGSASAQAAGTIGSAQAYSNALGTAGKYAMEAPLLASQTAYNNAQSSYYNNLLGGGGYQTVTAPTYANQGTYLPSSVVTNPLSY